MAKEKTSPIKRDILVRVRWLYALFILVGLAIVAKILYTQLGPGSAELRRRADEIVYRTVPLTAQRGDILACDGRIMATSIPVFDVRLDLAADVIDTTMKNIVRGDIRRAAAAQRERCGGDRDKIKVIDADMKARLHDQNAITQAGLRLLTLKLDTLAEGLSAIFGDRTAQVYRRLLSNAYENRLRNRSLLVNPREVNFSELKAMMRLPILNIKRIDPKDGSLIHYIPVRGCTRIEEWSQREHPFGSLALRTIGKSKTDSITVVENGQRAYKPIIIKYGVDGAFDQYLAGKDGQTVMQTISGISTVPVADPDNVEPQQGIDVVTTLDVELQDVAEKALRTQLEQQQAKWGCVVLMDVQSGEIRAMSNLTRYPDGRIVDDLNYAIGRNMEPGSTFKLASLITLLDDGGMKLDDIIDTEGGRTTVGRALVIDDHAQHAPITLRRVFEVSSNIGFSKSVHRIYASNPKRFVDFVCGLGLDKPLGIQIDGSVSPVIHHPGDPYWTPGMTLEKMAFGYTFEITPMRTLALYNAVANNGKMISPLLVKELRQYGRTVRTYSAQTIVQNICTPQTLSYVQESLEKVVEEGTARVLSNKNYKVAAKTGTAQASFGSHGYTDAQGGRRYLATMVGYFPADKPRYSCIVVMETYFGPGNYHTYYGASLSGPVFRAVADRVYGMQPSWHPAVGEGRQPVVSVIPVKGGETADIKTVASKLYIPIADSPSVAGWAITKPDSLRTEIIPVPFSAGSVPAVTGMGLKEALYLLEKVGLKVAFTGRGTVTSQSITAGTKVERGQVISIHLGI